jgi:hypothetical protein
LCANTEFIMVGSIPTSIGFGKTDNWCNLC